MQISVAEALKRVGELFPLDGTILPEGETWYGNELVFRSPVRVRGSYSFDSGAIILTGTIEAETKDRCSRCGKPIEVCLHIPFTERFVKDGSGDENEVYLYSGDVICLDRMIMDQIFLSYPMTPLCKEDCRGLCPVCGADLNEADCGCETHVADDPFAALKKLTNNDKEV